MKILINVVSAVVILLVVTNLFHLTAIPSNLLMIAGLGVLAIHSSKSIIRNKAR